MGQKEPGPDDAGALKAIKQALRPKSVILCEIITNKVLNGCVTGYFVRELLKLCEDSNSILVIDETLTAFRTGTLWAYEHIPGFLPHKVIFGKAFQLSGIATQGEQYVSDDAATTPAHAVPLFHARACLARAMRMFPVAAGKMQRARDIVESRFNNVQ